MSLLLALLPLLAAQDKADLSKTKLFVYDAEKGMTLRVKDDGKVELTVKEEDKDSGKKVEKVYAAGSAAEFEKKHPEATKKYGLGTYLNPSGGLAQNDLDRWWGDLRRNRRLLPEMPELTPPLEGEWEKWFTDQRKMMEEFRKFFKAPGEDEAPVPERPAPKGNDPDRNGGREFGIKIDAVGETLRDQLGLKEGEGVQVGEVKPGSIAEKSGVKQYDIILKLDGKDVGDKWEFRKDVLKAVDKPEFELQILRGGKKESLKARTGVKKED
jgi:PDZ domain-containing protein